jgi:hypothetical protein
MGFNCQPLPENPCPYFESGGVQCELEAGHEYDLFGTQHYYSPHTIAHNKAGNGWSCFDTEGKQFTTFGGIKYDRVGA